MTLEDFLAVNAMAEARAIVLKMEKDKKSFEQVMIDKLTYHESTNKIKDEFKKHCGGKNSE